MYEQCAIPDGLGGLIAVSAGGMFSLALVAVSSTIDS
jgi:hypothetical protein